MSGKEIVKALGAVFDACGTIQEAGACSACPLSHCCLDDTNFSEVCDTVSIGSFDELIGLAEDIEDHYNNEDAAAYFAEVKRKEEIEERCIEERYGY